jgi:resuscitation-promoting factor RpfA
MPARLRLPARASSDRRPFRQGLAAAGVAVFVASGAAACGGANPTASQLYALRMCESGGNYRINTGNGYYGAYQFSLQTWRGLGFGGYPHQASPATQDAAVRKLYARSGWSPWPVCGRRAARS